MNVYYLAVPKSGLISCPTVVDLEGSRSAIPTTGFPMCRDDLEEMGKMLSMYEPQTESTQDFVESESMIERLFQMSGSPQKNDILQGEFEKDLKPLLLQPTDLPCLEELLRSNVDVFGELPKPGSTKKWFKWTFA